MAWAVFKELLYTYIDHKQNPEDHNLRREAPRRGELKQMVQLFMEESKMEVAN